MSPATIKVLKSPCKRQDILSDFDQIWTFSPNFNESLQYQIPWKSVQWELSWYMWRDIRTDRHDEANRRFSRLCERA